MYPSLDPVTKSYGSHVIDESDILAVSNALRSLNLTGGDLVQNFEQALARVVGSSYVVVCSNGTAALHLATIAANIQPGDYVIVPSITFLATANAPRYCGANIIFCDVDPENGLLTEKTVLEAIQRSAKKPVALYPVDLAGQPACLTELHKLCQSNNIKIIQDSCHSLGTIGRVGKENWKIGQNKYSDFTTFSFHAVKNITTGEGGAITTNNPVAYQKLKQMRSHGMLRHAPDFQNHGLAFERHENLNPWYYEMQDVGYNYRLTDLQAALGLSQLKKLEYFKNTRKKLKAIYDRALRPYRTVISSIKIVENSDPCWHLYPVLIDFKALKKSRASTMRALSARGIGTQVHYIPVHLQPYYQKVSPSPELPGVMAYYERTLSLPLHVYLTEQNIEYIIQTLVEILDLK